MSATPQFSFGPGLTERAALPETIRWLNKTLPKFAGAYSAHDHGWFDVIHTYGASANGVSDDSTPLRKAVDAAYTSYQRGRGSSVLWVRGGTLVYDSSSSPLNIPSGVVLAGPGRRIARLMRKASATRDDLVAFGNTGSTESYCGAIGLTLDGNRQGYANTDLGAIFYVEDVEDGYFHELEIVGGASYNGAFRDAVRCTFSDIWTHHCNNDAFTTGDGCEFNQYSDIKSWESADDGMAFAATTAVNRGHVVTNYHSYHSGYDNAGAAGGVGLKFAGPVENITVTGCVIDSPGGCAVALAAEGIYYPPKNIRVTGLVATDCVVGSGAVNTEAVLISGAAEDIYVQGSIDTAPYGVGITATLSKRITLDVQVQNCTGYGIYASGSGANRPAQLTIRGRSSDNGTDGIALVAVDGVELDGFVAVDNNTSGSADNTQNCGAWLSGCTDVVIDGGRYSQDDASAANKQQHGIRFQGTACADVTMTGVQALNNVVDSISINATPTGSVQITGCTPLPWAGKNLVTYRSGVLTFQDAGAPAITAPKGSVYYRTDGGAGTTLYINETGTNVWRAV